MSEEIDNLLKAIDGPPAPPMPQPLGEIAYATSGVDPGGAATAYQKMNPADIQPHAVKTINKSILAERRDALMNDFTPENLLAYHEGIRNEVNKPPAFLISERAMENAALSGIEENDGGRTRDFAKGYFADAHSSSAVMPSMDWKAYNREEQKGSSSWVNEVAGNLQNFVGFGSQALAWAAKEFLGKNYVLNYGTMMRDIAGKIDSEPTPELRTAALEKALGIFNVAATDILGLVSPSGTKRPRNDVLMYRFMDDLKAYRAGEVSNAGHILNNAIGWLDGIGWLPIGAALRTAKTAFVSGAKALAEARLSPNHWFSRVASVNPGLAGKVADAALGDRKLAASLGTTPEEIASSMLPSSRAVPLDAGDVDKLGGGLASILHTIPQAIQDTLAVTTAEMKVGVNTLPNTGLYSKSTWDYAKQLTDKLLETVGMDLHLQKSAVGRSNNTNDVLFDAVYGVGKRGYASLKEATDALSKNIDNIKAKHFVLEEAKVMVLDKKTNTLSALGVEAVPKGSEYFIQLTGRKPLHIGLTMGFDPEFVRPLSKIWNWIIADPHFRMFGEVDTSFTIGSSLKDVTLHTLTRAQRDFFKLSNTSKIKVAQALEETRVAKAVMPYDVLVKRGFDEKEVIAYYTQRRGHDALYSGKDRVLRESMQAEGYKEIVTKDVTTAAIPIKDAEGMKNGRGGWVEKAWNPHTKENITLGSEAAIQKLLDEGYYFGRLKRNIFQRETEHTTILIHPKDTVNELPRNVLHYRPGHMSVRTTDPFLITVKNTVSGEDTVIATAVSRRAASDHVAKMNEAFAADGKGMHAEFDVAREYEAKKSLHDREIDDHTLDLWFEPKQPDLKRITGEAAPVTDALQATQEAINSFSSKVGLKDVVDVMTANLKKMWPQFWKGDQYIGHTMSDATDMALRRSNSVYDRIEVFKRVPSPVESFTSGMFLEFDRFISENLGAKASKLSGELLIKGLAQHSVGRALTRLAGGIEIALSPIKQLLLNVGTIPNVFVIDSVAGGKAVLEAQFLYAAAMLKHSGKDFEAITRAAVAVGHDRADFIKTVNGYLSTGKLAGVDSNVAMQELSFKSNRDIANNIATKLGQQLSQGYRIPVKLGRTFGIDAGESYYQAFLFSFEKQRWLKQHPGQDPFKDLKSLQSMGAEGRAFGYDMTLSGKMPYQHGLFAPITQFLAMSHKAALATVDAITGRSGRFSDKERASYVIGNTLLGGAAGWGITSSAWEGMKETFGLSNLPPEVDNAARGGLGELIGNYALYLAFNENVMPRVSISETIHPNGRMWTFYSNIMESLLDPSNKPFIQRIMGAAGKDVGGIYNYIGDLHTMWGWSGTGYTDTYDNLLTTMQRTAEFVKPLDGLMKYQYYLGMKNSIDRSVGMTKDRKTFLYDYLESEAFMGYFLGMDNTTALGYEKLIKDNKAIKDDVKAGAETIWRLMGTELLTSYSKETLDKFGRLNATISAGDPIVAFHLNAAITEIIRSQPKEAKNKLINEFISQNGMGPGGFRKLEYTVRQSGLTPEMQEWVLNQARMMFESAISQPTSKGK